MRSKKTLVLGAAVVGLGLLLAGCTIHFNTNGWVYFDGDSDGTRDYGFRLHAFLKASPYSNGAWLVHLNMDVKIMSEDGKTPEEILHYNYQLVLNAGQALSADTELTATALTLGNGDTLWMPMEKTAEEDDEVTFALEMSGEQGYALYIELPDVVAVGVRDQDGTEYWADAAPAE